QFVHDLLQSRLRGREWRKLLFDGSQRARFFRGDSAVKPANGKQGEQKAKRRGGKVRFLLVEFLAFAEAARHQVELNRAVGQVPQAKTDHFAHGVSDLRKILAVQIRSNVDV